MKEELETENIHNIEQSTKFLKARKEHYFNE